MADVTDLIGSWQSGGDAEFDALFTMLYRELQGLARRQVASGKRGETLRPTALVHEAYLRLAQGQHPQLKDRAHFMALAARVMRNVLVDKAREKNREKRGGDMQQVTLDERIAGDATITADVLAIDAALDRLAQLDARMADVA